MMMMMMMTKMTIVVVIISPLALVTVVVPENTSQPTISIFKFVDFQSGSWILQMISLFSLWCCLPIAFVVCISFFLLVSMV